MRKEHIHALVLIFFTALLVVCSQLVFSHNPQESDNENQTQKQDNNQNDAGGNITLTSLSQSSPMADIQVSHRSCCLFEIFFEAYKAEISRHNVPLLLGKLLQTLFRVTISPNAP